MENRPRRSERSNIGQLPKKFENFTVQLPDVNRPTMFRTPVRGNAENEAELPPQDGTNVAVPARARSVASSRRSVLSKASSAQSQIRNLELENQLEEEELNAQLEQDRIIAEQKLEELRIHKELQLKAKQRQTEFLKKKKEREMKILEFKSCSESSSVCTSVERVQDWVNRSGDGQDNTDDVDNISRVVEASPTSPGVHDVLTQAFKALQTRQMKDLPTFSGNVMEWPIFENEYRTSTKEFNLNDRENLRRLNKALDGKARQAVESLLSAAENVDHIMKMLKSNFGRTEWVVASRLEMLRNLDNVKEGNIESFRVFYNAVVGTSIALKNVKADAYLMNPELISHLTDKLPVFSKQMWTRHKATLTRRDEVVDFQSFVCWLEDEMENQLASVNPSFGGRSQTLQSSSTQPFASRKATPSYGPGQRTKPVFTINEKDDRADQRADPCPLCKSSEHSGLASCGQFGKLSLDQRRTAARNCKVCYVCLESDHVRQKCRSNRLCATCNKNHHELVHSDENTAPTPAPRFSGSRGGSNSGDVCNVNVKAGNTLLRVAKVRIRCGDIIEEIFALFDEGSTLSMIDADLAERMQLTGPVSPVTYRWTNGIVHRDDTSMVLSLHVAGSSQQAKWHDLSNVRSCNNMCLPQVKLDLEKITSLYPMIEEDKLVAIQNATPRLLIGSNNAGLIVPLKTVQYSLNGLQLTRCHLGWTIHGQVELEHTNDAEMFHVLVCDEAHDHELTTLIKQLYRVENFGIADQEAKLSEEDERAIDIMNRTLKRCDDHFEVGQLYRYNNFNFPDSKPQALRRLHVMEKKMDSDAKFADQYCGKIEDYLQKGYARKLNPDELGETPNTWYLPHFSVVSANKFRLVMDAKAKSHGFSLNDLLLKGPDMVPPLIAVLMRGRRKKVGFIADIKEMFHQVEIRREDQNSQRFFFRGMDRMNPPDVYVMKAMIFGAVSSPSIAQFIKNFNAKELDSSLPGVERAIVEQHYVDDYFDCADSIEEALKLIASVTTAHERGGFQLVKFASNSEAVLDALDPSLVAELCVLTKETRVLGLKWDLQTDEFVFSLDFPNFGDQFRSGEVLPTKRQLLKFMMSIFDPLGILSPITIHLKIMFQELWRLQIGWDDMLPDGLVARWKEWLEETSRLGEVRLARFYFPELPSFACVELHAFCDASDKAYACVIYMMYRQGNKSYVSLVYAKSRVASLKCQTVPRLELQGCVLASQMMKVVEVELKVEVVGKYFWTDSKICLSWMRTKEKLTAYVGARVTKIKDNGHSKEVWHWIPSHLNIADLGTKSSKFYIVNWIRGPTFLYQDKCCYPSFEEIELSTEELIYFHAEVETPIVHCFQLSKITELIKLPDISRFSDFNRLVRSTAYYLKMRKILTLRRSEKPQRFSINVNDISEARNTWIRHVQLEIFGQDILCLESTGFVKRSSRLYPLSPFLGEDGIIRMRGRIQDEDKLYEENNPAILPDNHDFTTLLIRMHHIANGHQGLETVVNNLRRRYCILKIRSQVKKFSRSCVRCRELRGKPNVTQMGNLPPERTTPFVHPFTYTGIDYFGPMLVKVGRRLEKRWVALFTCLTTRALHLEVVTSLDTNSCIMAIRCFMAIRGIPKKIFTDNGTNFTGADNELKKLWRGIDQTQIEEAMSVREVEWSFIPPGAPHFGGCWERLVRSVKAGLGGMLKDHHPTDNVLRTTLCEVMNTINNRPLVQVSSDPQDPDPLTPNMLLLGRNNVLPYEHNFDQRMLNCRALYKHAQIFANRFWQKWIASYRPELLKRQKWPDNRNYHDYNLGDLVMIVDENLNRGFWPKGVIERVIPGADGRIRTVVVRTAKSTFKRPVTKIILLQAISGAPEDVGNTA